MSSFPNESLFYRWLPHNENKTKNVLVATTSDGKITHWHTASGKVLHQMEEKDNSICCMDFSPDGSLFATAGDDRNVRIYDDNMKTVESIMKPGGLNHPGHSNRIFSIRFHKTMNIIASGGWDNTVQFYDLRSKTVIGSVHGPHICGDSIDFKEYELLTGSWATSNQIQVWDIRNYKMQRMVEWGFDKELSTYVYACQFSKSNKIPNFIGVGCSNKDMVRIFDCSTNDLPIMSSVNLRQACYTIDFSNNGKYFAFGSGDGNVRIVNLENKKEKEEEKEKQRKKEREAENSF